jgi:hypothetical protein
VQFLRDERELTLEEALREAAARHDAEVRHFIGCEQSLPSFGPGVDEAVVRYVKGLRCWMRAHLDGSSSRYRPGTEPFALVQEDQRGDTSPGRPRGTPRHAMDTLLTGTV